MVAAVSYSVSSSQRFGSALPSVNNLMTAQVTPEACCFREALFLRVFIQLRRKSSHSALLLSVHALGSESVHEIGSYVRYR
jgi:hypothetical protein